MTATSATRMSHLSHSGGRLLDSRALARTFAACLAVNVPILALLLIPQLMRSRAGSEALLTVGLLLLLTLVVGAVMLAPEVSARVAPAGPHWLPGGARARVRALRCENRRTYLWRLGEFVALYVAAQGVGGLIAWLLPHVADNPAHAADPTAPAWIVDYPNYAAQAGAMYVCICFALAWYGTRLRAESVRSTPTAR
ncbi:MULTISPECIES: hypothetical protein [unclassified Streptomyces]|uniref:hypothetical protein n=1 Tax=unclassified Streptomyces TaxID=2593676 RepID=UPI001587050F|nr:MULTISPECIES: hypothetical protein [unclassified Streptomyces]NUV70365.1 hypothetical protein [Streptomyces sp. CAI-121]NUV99344.1 hypothetical protein [Streptomyces sp. CAI 127]NUW16523.1 hypothetical protein [Streptomyces sp. CAI-68]